jgi:hypothetical protein
MIPRFINELRRILIINISMYENFYAKTRFKLVKFGNFETPSPNYSAPSAPISL